MRNMTTNAVCVYVCVFRRSRFSRSKSLTSFCSSHGDKPASSSWHVTAKSIRPQKTPFTMRVRHGNNRFFKINLNATRNLVGLSHADNTRDTLPPSM